VDNITTRAIVIAVNVFITIAIVSIVIIMFFQKKEIYGVVAKTDNSIYSTFDNVYSMYNGRTMSGLGLLNTIKKYEDKTEENIVINYPGSDSIKEYVSVNNIRESVYLKSLMEDNIGYRYEDKYNVTVDTAQQGLVTLIVFNRIGT